MFTEKQESTKSYTWKIEPFYILMWTHCTFNFILTSLPTLKTQHNQQNEHSLKHTKSFPKCTAFEEIMAPVAPL